IGREVVGGRRVLVPREFRRARESGHRAVGAPVRRATGRRQGEQTLLEGLWRQLRPRSLDAAEQPRDLLAVAGAEAPAAVTPVPLDDVGLPNVLRIRLLLVRRMDERDPERVLPLLGRVVAGEDPD